ncbi:MAG: N-acetylornithine carbamoyltransferase [Ginsengibacter sp.]
MKNFLSVNDIDGQVDELVSQALEFKKNPLMSNQLGRGKRIGLLFMNPSMRTRLSTQIAAQNLGMEAIMFNASSDGWQLEFGDGAVMNGKTVEHIKDAAPVLGSYFDVLGIRTFPGLKNKEEDYSENVINQFVQYSGIPVVSLESATVHPLQSFTDAITISEQLLITKIERPKVVLTWAPHIKALPQCVSNSFAEWMNAWEKVDLVITHPEGYELDKKFVQNARVIHDQQSALANADFVYVKNWSSYEDYGQVIPVNENWMLDNQKMSVTNNAKVMHCLPVRRNVELSDEILDGANSLVTTQASNRVWAAQTVLANLLKNG